MASICIGLAGLMVCLSMAWKTMEAIGKPLEGALAERGRPPLERRFWVRAVGISFILVALFGGLHFFPRGSLENGEAVWLEALMQIQAAAAGLLLTLAGIGITLVITAILDPHKTNYQTGMKIKRFRPFIDYTFHPEIQDRPFPDSEGWESDYEAPRE